MTDCTLGTGPFPPMHRPVVAMYEWYGIVLPPWLAERSVDDGLIDPEHLTPLYWSAEDELRFGS